MAGWTKMSLGTEVGLSAGDFVLDDTYVQIGKRFFAEYCIVGDPHNIAI